MDKQIFCRNPECADYLKIEANNLHKFGFSRKGTQRYKCRTCNRTLTDTKGTLFHRKQYKEETIIECLRLLSHYDSLPVVSRLTKVHPDTIMIWLKKVSENKRESALILCEHDFSEAEIARLWSYVPKQKPRPRD